MIRLRSSARVAALTMLAALAFAVATTTDSNRAAASVRIGAQTTPAPASAMPAATPSAVASAAMPPGTTALPSPATSAAAGAVGVAGGTVFVPTASDIAKATPQRLLGLIRQRYRSHRPPPPYVTYTMERYQLATTGFTDFVGSYTYHIWTRTSDRASLGLKVFRDQARGNLEFQRPAFNEDRDPGPPTADVFEPAPLKPHSIAFVPTAEPIATPLPVIGQVKVFVELDYNVTSVAIEGSQFHVILEPLRDPSRNRLRELWVDRKTLELQKFIATDLLFVEGDRNYGVLFTVKLSTASGFPVVTDIHGKVGDGYDDDGKEVDYHFRDVKFPATLPDWYFDPHQYAAHKDDGLK